MKAETDGKWVVVLCSLINCHHGGQNTSQLHEDHCPCVLKLCRTELGNSESGKSFAIRFLADDFTLFLALYTRIIICTKENNINIYKIMNLDHRLSSPYAVY